MKRTILLVLLGATAPASADRWMTAEIPASVAVSSMQEQAFRPGAMPAVGAYISSGRFAVGARLRAGVLRDGAAPGGNMADPGVGGLFTAGVAGRFQVGGGGWIELVAGGGVTGTDLVPTFEAGAGWLFGISGVEVGPSVRYVRVVAASSDAFGSADLVLVGADLSFGHDHERVVHAPIVVAQPAPPPPPPPAPTVAPDDDRLVDRAASCSDLIEFLDEASGCGDGAAVQVAGDRIILDDRVLFDTDHARVRSAGREVVRAIAKAAAQHPEWVTITIEGHADVRGDDDYNQTLSEKRAEHVRDVMVRAGVPEDRVKSVGYGRSRPRDPGTTEEAHRHNRRVEFVIDRAPHAAEEVTP